MTEDAQNDNQDDITRQDDEEFAEQMDALVREAEAIRLRHMKAMRTRSFIAMSVGLVAIVVGAAGFGWFLLVEADILRSIGSIALGVVIAAGLHFWSAQALREYKRAFKREFLPQMATLLGGFKYHPSRGISRKVIGKTGVIPQHDSYEAEDCFMGRYKGVKVLFSEARLKSKKSYAGSVFNGLFGLLEIPTPKIPGHIILSADQDMVRRWANTRWNKLKKMTVKASNPEWERFEAFSDTPDPAQKLITDKLLKELSEAADVFDESPLTAVFFRKKYIFIMVPYDGDMFEASEIHAPVATKQHALKCKKEIEQLLEIIDVFDLYEAPPETSAPANPVTSSM